jgi:hypothetical protein
VEPVNRRGKSVSRVLYWYRTPPDVKVGREPFDAAVRKALEAQNPTVRFDWRQILETPIPSADAEKWRERRRAERSERAARQALDEQDEPVAVAAVPMVVPDLVDGVPSMNEGVVSGEMPDSPVVERSATAAIEPTAAAADGAPAGAPRRKRRRRRGGRQKPAPGTEDTVSAAPSAGGEHATETDE